MECRATAVASSVRLFCYGFGDHPELHSFPTRRSSDLMAPQRIMGIARSLLDASTLCAISTVSTRGTAHINTAYFARSEEHTSELQSQSNLVCRLLLEKKNSRSSTTTTM